MANFFVEKRCIFGENAVIEGDEAKHIARVLRMEKGDLITLSAGEGVFYDCEITSVGEKSLNAHILRQYPAPTEPKLKITLYQGIPKNPKLETIVQKAVEIGAVRIVPTVTSRIVAKAGSENKTERLRKIAYEAAKQSKRGIIPEVSSPLSFQDAVDEAAMSDGAIIPYEEERSLSLKAALHGKEIRSLAVFIGPEGGFEEKEISKAASAGIIPVTLGRRILRTETAGLAVMAAAMYEFGEME